MNEKLLTLKNNAAKYNLILSSEQLVLFEKFEEFIKEFNKHTNLLSSNDINLIYEKHFLDCISISKILDININYNIIDIGSGGGFPCIPISVIYNNSSILAIDSTNKKVDFLNKASDLLSLKNFKAINERAENLSHRKSYREKFDIVTARAVGNLALISELCLPFLKIGGKFIAYKAAKVNEEIEQANNTITVLGGRIVDIFEYDLELQENYTRNLVVIEKVKESPIEYPRSFSAIKNNPILTNHIHKNI